jgi:glycosyltransferase involved in cell wall biosynthesis
MKLLIITQAVDRNNTTLGFFHRWLEEFSARYESVEVICLYEGDHALPQTVSVHSLGKEKGNTRIKYIQNFFSYIWKLRTQYDAVFVHMNQEYVILGGLFWKLFGKKIFFWRNHPYGNFLTRIAVYVSDQVFCTADKSFTARYAKTHLMPAGVDTSIFFIPYNVERQKYSLLVFGRIAPVKHIEKAIDVTALLLARGIPVELSIVGDWLPRDTEYVQSLKERVVSAHIESQVAFIRGVDFLHAPQVYRNHEIFLNFTESGSFDKTVIESLACGTKVLVSNVSMKDVLPQGSYTTGEYSDIVEKVIRLQSLNAIQEEEYRVQSDALVQEQSLSRLMDLLYTYIYGNR